MNMAMFRARQRAAEPEEKEVVIPSFKPTTATKFASHGWDTIVFGSAPNPHRPWSYDYGTAARLARLVGKKLTWFNLFETEPERWSPQAARESAEEWCLEYARLRHTPLILLGTKVCEAFGIEDIQWLESYASQLWSPMIAFPHPSGLNRWWNDPENERAAWRVGRSVTNGTYFRRTNAIIRTDDR